MIRYSSLIKLLLFALSVFLLATIFNSLYYFYTDELPLKLEFILLILNLLFLIILAQASLSFINSYLNYYYIIGSFILVGSFLFYFTSPLFLIFYIIESVIAILQLQLASELK